MADIDCMNGYPVDGNCRPYLLDRNSRYVGKVPHPTNTRKKYLLFQKDTTFEGSERAMTRLGRFLICEDCFEATEQLAFIYLTSLPSDAL